jgi:4-amino-4-deoxy-L-arabinose transferase-like glycosyltransferase
MVTAAIVYLRTAARDLVVGDSVEFATIALNGGVAHPPGYPLLMLLGRLFSYLPFGTPVFRVNLVSVVAGVATAGLVVLIARRLGASRFGAAIAGLLVAFHPIVWEWSLAIEAFALNAALASAIIYFLVRWHQQPERTLFLILAALFGGLASSNHHTIVFLIPSILLLLWWHRDQLVKKPIVVAWCAGAIIVGLLPYLYILSEAAKDPALNWGNVRTFGQLLNHFLRAEYGTGRLAAGGVAPGVPIERLTLFASSFLILEAVLLVVGVVAAYQRCRWFLWFTLLTFVLAGPGLIAYANMDVADEGRWVLEHFFVLPHVIVAPLAALGFTYIAEQLGRYVKPVLTESVLAVVALALIAVPVSQNYRKLDQHDNRIVRTYAEDVLASLPRQTVLMATEDQIIIPLTYLQAVEKQRPDVTVIMLGLFKGGQGSYIRELKRRKPDLVVPFDQYNRRSSLANTKAFLDANPGRRFALIGAPLDSSLFTTYWTYQRGLINMVLPRSVDVNYAQMSEDFLSLTSKYRFPDARKAKMGTYERRIIRSYAVPYLRLAQQFRAINKQTDADSLVRRAMEIDPTLRRQGGSGSPK